MAASRVMSTVSTARRVARVLPIAADPLALPLQVLAVLALPIFGALELTIPRAMFLLIVGALAAFALVVGVEVRHQPRSNWGTGAMWIVLGAIFAVETALMIYALALK